MPRFAERTRWRFALVLVILCISRSSQIPAFGQTIRPDAHDEGDHLRSAIKGANLGDWRYNGFEAVDVSDALRAPWYPYLTPTKGYVAMFINSSKDIPNSGKGGAAEGTRHPEFTLWIFPRTDANTPKHFEESIRAHQMVQSSIPTILGANKDYVLACVGDIDMAEAQITQLAQSLKIARTGAR